MSKKLKLQEENKDQYGGISGQPHVIKTKSLQEKKNDEVDNTIRELNGRITTQYKVIDKLVRDVKRLKDQISELAGRIPRG